MSNKVLEKPASSAYLEDGGSRFLRNAEVYTCLTNNVASHSRWQQCTKHEVVNTREGDKSLINQLMHSIIKIKEVKIYIIQKSTRHTLKYSNMFRITYDPSSGSDKMYLIEITYNGSIVLLMWVVGVWRHIYHQTPTTHIISTIEPLLRNFNQVHFITPWWWILCDPKHVGVF